MEHLTWLAALLGWLVAARCTVAWLRGAWRDFVFAALNVAGVYWFLFFKTNDHFRMMFAVYAGVVLWQFAMLKFFATARGWKPWLAFFAPVLFLIVVRYAPLCLPDEMQSALKAKYHLPIAAYFVGVSYLAFRSSHLVLEVRNGVVPRPSLWRYLGFCFFLPTMTVGPINPYSNFARAFETKPPEIPAARAALRVIVGAAKFFFLGALCNRLTYEGLFFDDHPHHFVDLPVAMIFYYLYLYCNFSGFCDLAIGVAGLLGVPVLENFDNPFAARNVKDFWNRWHITLSIWMRDVVFSPLSKFLVGKFGPANANHAIALTITVVFLLVGLWHGVGWNYAAFGAMHALGVVANHYYTIWLKKKLGREKFKAYNENRVIRVAAVGLTFVYIAASLFLFANTIPEMKQIFYSLHW
jgi:D-alanyl-lipoteichoic acid acyltransferase DltB (MBOAT superfamily)